MWQIYVMSGECFGNDNRVQEAEEVQPARDANHVWRRLEKQRPRAPAKMFPRPLEKKRGGCDLRLPL